MKADPAAAGQPCQCTRCHQVMTIPALPVGIVVPALPWLKISAVFAGVLALAAIVLVVFFRFSQPSVAQSLKDLKNGSPDARAAALAWLAEADPQDNRRAQVTAVLEPIVFEGDIPGNLNPDLVLRAYLHWAGPDNVPALLRMVDNRTLPAWNTRNAGHVLQTLGKFPSEQTLSVLTGHLDDAALHDDAVAALKLVGPKARSAMLDYIFTGDKEARQRATDLLEGYGTSFDVFVDAALDRLQSNEPAVRESAAAWCAENAPDNEGQKGQGAKLLLPFLNDLSPRVNHEGLLALKRWATKDCLPQLVDYANRQAQAPATKEANENAGLLLDILAQLPDARAATAIALRLPQPELRDKAVQALLLLGPVANDAVLPYLNHPDPAVGKEARKLTRSLQPGGNDRQITQSLTDLADPRKARSRAALEYLAKLEPDTTHRAAVSKALKGLLLDTDAETAERALDAVLVWGTPENTEALLKLLGALDRGGLRPDHPNKVATALVRLGPSVEEGVLPFLKSPSRNIRGWAATILGDVGTRKSLKPLQEAADLYILDGGFRRQTAAAADKINART
jgi:hypothetical protein